MIDDPDQLPDAPGAYLLLLHLPDAVSLPRRFDHRTLPEGRFGYAGSAYGPGGIRARCRRHLSRPDKRRWHIDWLTSAAIDVQAFPFPGGSECRLIERLSKRGDVSFPIQGFGSTDCRRCPAHLIEFSDPVAFEGRDVLADLQDALSPI